MTVLKTEVKDSSHYKSLMKKHLYLKNYYGVVEESVNHWNADIIGVNSKWEINEFEIKVAPSDLKGEVKAIIRALQGGIYKSNAGQMGLYSYNRVEVEEKVSLTKLEKHYCYLVDDKQGGMQFNGTPEEEARMNLWRDRTNKKECFVPSKFYFAVPTEMVELAKTLLLKVPYYGIVNADTGDIKKPAKRLPRENTRQKDVMNLFLRACTEWRQTSYSLQGYKERAENGVRIKVRRKYKWTDYHGNEHEDWI